MIKEYVCGGCFILIGTLGFLFIVVTATIDAWEHSWVRSLL